MIENAHMTLNDQNENIWMLLVTHTERQGNSHRAPGIFGEVTHTERLVGKNSRMSA